MNPSPYVRDIANELPVGEALDIGAGDGRNVRWLADIGWQVDALEVDPRQLAPLVSAGAHEVRMKDISTTTLPVSHYDLVICNMVLHFLPSRKIVRSSLRKIRDSVSPGGTIYLSAFTPDNEVGLRPHLVSIGELLVEFDGWELHVLDCRRTARAVLKQGQRPHRAKACRVVLRRPLDPRQGKK
jgi:SAM-dependent methyltransferase